MKSHPGTHRLRHHFDWKSLLLLGHKGQIAPGISVGHTSSPWNSLCLVTQRAGATGVWPGTCLGPQQQQSQWVQTPWPSGLHRGDRVGRGHGVESNLHCCRGTWAQRGEPTFPRTGGWLGRGGKSHPSLLWKGKETAPNKEINFSLGWRDPHGGKEHADTPPPPVCLSISASLPPPPHLLPLPLLCHSSPSLSPPTPFPAQVEEEEDRAGPRTVSFLPALLLHPRRRGIEAAGAGLLWAWGSRGCPGLSSGQCCSWAGGPGVF